MLGGTNSWEEEIKSSIRSFLTDKILARVFGCCYGVIVLSFIVVCNLGFLLTIKSVMLTLELCNRIPSVLLRLFARANNFQLNWLHRNYFFLAKFFGNSNWRLQWLYTLQRGKMQFYFLISYFNVKTKT